MTTKTKIIIAIVLVALIVGLSIFFYNRGKKATKKLSTKNEADAIKPAVTVKVTTPANVTGTTEDTTAEIVN